MNEREYIDTDIMYTKSILNAFYGCEIKEQHKYDLILILKNGTKRPANTEPISITEVMHRIYQMIIYGKNVVKFEIIKVSTK